MNGRGQITIEFMVIMSFAFILLVVLLVVVAYNATTTSTAALAEGVDDIAESIEIEVTTAYVIGDGYQSSFALPQRVQGRAYSINLTTSGNASVISIVSGLAHADRRLPACGGSLAPGMNTIIVHDGVMNCTAGGP